MTIFLDALVPLVDVFEELGIAYYIGGSLASIAHGVPRTTLDIDLIADLSIHHVPLLVARLQSHYYIYAAELLDAIQHRSAFNLIHLASLLKLDVFVAPDRAFDRSKAQRAQSLALTPETPRQFWITSPEDIILQKLEWYLLGGQVSERQWQDVQGVLKVQSAQLDQVYLRYWAAQLGVAALLERARSEASSGDG